MRLRELIDIPEGLSEWAETFTPDCGFCLVKLAGVPGERLAEGHLARAILAAMQGERQGPMTLDQVRQIVSELFEDGNDSSRSVREGASTVPGRERHSNSPCDRIVACIRRSSNFCRGSFLPFRMPTHTFQTIHAPEARTFDPENGCELRLVRRDRDNLSAFELVFPGQTIPFAAECAIVTPSSAHPDGINELAYAVFMDDFLRNLPNSGDVQEAIRAALTAYGYSHGRGPNRTTAVHFR